MKRIFIFVLLVCLLLISSCGNSNNKKQTDETTNTLDIYVWVSSKTEFFTADELDVMKKCFKKQNPEVDAVWHLVQNCSKEEFGKKVNDEGIADVILGAVNMDSSDGSNIKIKTGNSASKTLIHSSWVELDERYIGICEDCSATHLENALKLKDMITKDKPELYKKQNVLFIGNSYTFYNDQYKVFRSICESQGMDINVETVVKSATSLSNVLDVNSEEYSKLIGKLQIKDFNYVIMQEQSTKPIFSRQVFELDVKNLSDLIHEYNPDAKIVLFETWAREVGSSFYTENPTYDYKSAEKALLDSYKGAADKYGYMISYAGVGFYYEHLKNLGMKLYQSDLTHPSGAGTYLAALIHAGTLFGINPKDVTYVPTFTIEASGGNRIQPTAEECALARDIAYDVIYNLDLSVFD